MGLYPVVFKSGIIFSLEPERAYIQVGFFSDFCGNKFFATFSLDKQEEDISKKVDRNIAIVISPDSSCKPQKTIRADDHKNDTPKNLS